ncbi:Outer membrane protein assembly factor BamA precursor [Phycisphaerae bacterium RAS1]|nr:Outer membrane protein assembly factor BamA precursor [Phycisphaerae bacterium RAS1]
MLRVTVLVILTTRWAAPAAAQTPPVPDGTPVGRVEFAGLDTISESYCLRVVKTRERQALSATQVQEDVRELLKTRKFLNVVADTRVEAGEATVTFRVQEKPAVVSLEIVGAQAIKQEKLFEEVGFAAGEPLDRFLVGRGRENILRKYKEKGYYYATVELDEAALRDGRVIYRVSEGPRVRVRKVRFEGNRAFPDARLKLKIQTKTYLWIFRSGAFDDEQAERDALDLQQFYRDEGFLDARVGYQLEFDEAARENLAVVFVIEEGDRYKVEEITIEGNQVFDDDRLKSEMRLVPGDFLRAEKLKEDVRRVQDVYGGYGFVDAGVDTRSDFTETPGVVIVRYLITENKQSRVGRITIRGNIRTKDEVIRRELRFYPGDLYSTVKARKAEQEVRETGLFTRATITPLEDKNGLREALVEVDEREAIDFLIGVGVSTDSGLLGSLTIENRNFDIGAWPRTWGQLFRGQAFRGDGQRLRLVLEPGTEVSRFRIDYTEPYLLDKELRFDQSFYLFERNRGPYDEARLGLLTGLSKRFRSGPLDGWAVEGAVRVEQVEIDDVKAFAARDIRDARGDHFLTSFKGSIVRDTTDSRLLPSEGYRWSFSWEQVGALGGDYSFGKPSTNFTFYKTLRTDIFDRKSILAMRADAAYIAGDAPVFERYYAGGFGSIRGFEFRGVSPRQGVYDDPIGGGFILLTGGEYSFPLYAKTVRGVTFLDMGTVERDFEITGWRAAIGFGLRINLDFFGPVPIVLDFGFPIADENNDEKRVFNFAFGASF